MSFIKKISSNKLKRLLKNFIHENKVFVSENFIETLEDYALGKAMKESENDKNIINDKVMKFLYKNII